MKGTPRSTSRQQMGVLSALPRSKSNTPAEIMGCSAKTRAFSTPGSGHDGRACMLEAPRDIEANQGLVLLSLGLCRPKHRLDRYSGGSTLPGLSLHHRGDSPYWPLTRCCSRTSSSP